MPSGHFASLSETAQRDYIQTVRAAERGLVSGRKVQTGPQYVTPLHPDDPRLQESDAQQVALVYRTNLNYVRLSEQLFLQNHIYHRGYRRYTVQNANTNRKS